MLWKSSIVALQLQELHQMKRYCSVHIHYHCGNRWKVVFFDSVDFTYFYRLYKLYYIVDILVHSIDKSLGVLGVGAQLLMLLFQP